MAHGNAGKGRVAGSRNKRTLAILDLMEEGETPCAFALRIMRDESQDADLRLHAAKLAAPYIHARPQPEPRVVELALPEDISSAAGLMAAHETILRAIASGELSLEDARDLSGVLETQRRLVETVELEQRLAKLEGLQTR
jgi:hypothetical protein